MRKKALGTYAIAKICQVAPITVGRWIEEGKLPYFTTGGGHRRVWEEDLAKFLKTHNYPLTKNLESAVRPTVLIVDDDPNVRRMIHRVIEQTLPQVQIEEAVDCFEAGEKISECVPSLVIFNLGLPGLDGFKVCERVRQNKNYKRMKLLAVASDRLKETQSRIIRAGADGFITKPLDPQMLQKAIQRLVDPS